jgi:gliding motility-associated-like protein
MIGLQNYARNKAKIPFGRGAEDPIWGSVGMNEAWRFVPAQGPTLLRSVELFDLNGNRVAVGDTVNIGNGEFSVTFPSVCPVGNTTYLVRSKYQDIVNPNAFVYGQDTFRVFSNNPLRADTVTTQASCATGGVGTMFIFADGIPGATYEYSIDTGRTWQPSGFYASVPPGQYEVKFRVVNGNCRSSILVTVPADPNFVSGRFNITNITCNAANNGVINVIGQNGSGNFTYSIDTGRTWQPSGTFANLAPGTYLIRLKDATGCSRDTVIRMLEPDLLTLNASPTDATCSLTANGRISLEADGGTPPYQYSLNGNVYQSAAEFTVIDSTHTITVRDANGCLKAVTQVVALNNNMQLSVRNDTTICLGSSVTLTTTSNAADFSWIGSSLSANNVASPVATPTAVGSNNYYLTATLGRCIKKDTVVVTTQSQIQVNAGRDTSILYGQSIQLNGTATGASEYLWTSTPNDPSISSTNAPNPTVTPTRTTTYTLTATNSSGCKATASVTVTIIPVCVKVRNAFSPNGDGINDKWKVYEQYDCLTNISLIVFNRYGSKIFESKNYQNDWDGNYKGKPVPDGTYYSVIEFTLINGQKQTVRTDLTIIR